MDIMELGAIGEFVGGLAVIASLIFVGLQVRQSNRQARDDAAREVQNQFDRIFEMIISDPKAREVWVAATGGAESGPLANPAGFDTDDLAVYGMVMARVCHQFESHYRAWRTGTLEDGQWAKVLPFIRFHLSSEPTLDIWRWQRDGWHDPGFTAYIDDEVRKLHGEVL